MESAVKVAQVTHVYVTQERATLAVQDIDFAIEQGEFVSMIGPSGCGKTTLLSMIAGLLAPTDGHIAVGGVPVAGPSPKVGYMLQQDYLFPWRTIAENACFGLEIAGRLTKSTKDAALELLDEMGLLKFKDYYPSQLSGGMRQRVALVRTLATEPELLLLDEPFSALDYQTKLQLEELVLETLRAKKKTALLVTHDISEAIAMSDRVLVLDPNPGRLRRTFAVPTEIRDAVPLAARELPSFHELFRRIWQEFGGEANAE